MQVARENAYAAISFLLASVLSMRIFRLTGPGCCVCVGMPIPRFMGGVEFSHLDFGAYNLTNVTLGLNYGRGSCKLLDRGFVTFTSNRVWSGKDGTVLHCILLMYPSGKIRDIV